MSPSAASMRLSFIPGSCFGFGARSAASRRRAVRACAAGAGAGPEARAAAPTLTGARVTLRGGRDGDAGALRALLREPRVARWWGDYGAPETVRAVIRGDVDAWTTSWLVCDEDGRVQGLVQAVEEDERFFRHAGLDVAMSERVRGRGLGGEAIRLVREFLVRERGHHRITIDPAAENEAAVAAFTKLGFRTVGVMKRYWFDQHRGEWRDNVLMEWISEPEVH